MRGGISRSQARGQKKAGVTLKNQQGVKHVVAITTVEEAELLLAMSGIVGGVDVEQNLATLADLVATHTDELLAQQVVGVHQIASGRGVLPATEGGLGPERFAQFRIAADRQHGT